MVTYYVKAKDTAARVAKLAYKSVKESRCIELQALGNMRVSTAVKSATKALGMLMSDDIISTIVVNYGSTECSGKDLSTVRIQLKKV
ncbi:MAG: stage V sporulation protein S [Oscillospiraceae bacterium]|nr:stage V sporulation protein S [Oscillospiraceae bacterium]